LKSRFWRREHQREQETLLSFEAVTLEKRKGKPFLENVNLKLKRGEILGVAGVEGNGQKELAEVLIGIQKQTTGTITLNGLNIDNCSVRKRFQLGIAYISDDRQLDSLILDMSVSENLILHSYGEKPQSKLGFLNLRGIANMTLEKIARYNIKAPDGGAIVRSLSGGNQQKVVLAREIGSSPTLIVANQPTRGLDISAAESIRETLVEERNKGGCVLLISADLEEILVLSDRVAVMFDGHIQGILSRREATIEKLGLLMGGQSGGIS
jgi:simple sugar transport system ATP-binding protein